MFILLDAYFTCCRLIQVYARSPETVQKVIRLHSYGLIKLFGPNSPPLLSLMRDPPKGAETLMLRVLLVLTDKGKKVKV
jgi:hypothetical protein